MRLCSTIIIQKLKTTTTPDVELRSGLHLQQKELVLRGGRADCIILVGSRVPSIGYFPASQHNTLQVKNAHLGRMYF